MVIRIEKATKQGNKDTLKMKDLLGPEYVILSRNAQFGEPLSGESQYGTWYLYNVDVHEYLSVDPKTLKQEQSNTLVNVSYFTSEKANIKKALDNHPIGTKLKITMVENDKGKKIYSVETVGNHSQPTATVPNATTAKNVNERVAELKKVGVSLQSTIDLVVKEYSDQTAATITMIYNNI